jgi:hypothetical protein
MDRVSFMKNNSNIIKYATVWREEVAQNWSQ